MKFCTVLNSLKSPQNVGMIVRSHVAYGGKEIIFTGVELPWRFKKSSQAFSRKLEKLCKIIHIKDQFDALVWCTKEGYSKVAIEIKENPVYLDEFTFPENNAFIFGNEGSGLDTEFLNACDHVITVRQIGKVGSLNVAASASIVMHELNRNSQNVNFIINHKYYERHK